MKARTFDCVEMQHRGMEKIKEQVGRLTQGQELAFWRERSQILRQRQERAQKERQTSKNEEP